VPAEYADSSAVAVNVAEQLTRFGIKSTVRTVTFTQHPIEINEGKFQLAIRGWGAADPHPHFSFDIDMFVDNIKIPPGMSFPLKQRTSAGEIDLEKVVVDSADGLDENAQKALVTKAALAFNELLPIIPIYERYGNNPTAEGVRVKGWPADGDPIYTNSPYNDSFVIMLMYEGKLQPV
jgi:peptide/nickel transport system substrate-binding protein